MDKELIKDKIRKLQNHAQSARRIGNQAEAKAYSAKAKRLMKVHKVTAAELAKPTSLAVKGKWVCSCGASIALDIDAGQYGHQIAESWLAPHRANGHVLKQVH